MATDLECAAADHYFQNRVYTSGHIWWQLHPLDMAWLMYVSTKAYQFAKKIGIPIPAETATPPTPANSMIEEWAINGIHDGLGDFFNPWERTLDPPVRGIEE